VPHLPVAVGKRVDVLQLNAGRDRLAGIIPTASA
jgi:hypothetical protein